MDLSRGKAITKYSVDEFAISSSNSSSATIGAAMLFMVFALVSVVLLGRRTIRSYSQRSRHSQMNLVEAELSVE